MQLNVPFSEIPENGVEYEINDLFWIPERLAEQACSASVHVRLTRKNDNRIEVRGHLKASVALECDRCLKQFIFQVDSPMLLVLEVEVDGKKDRWSMHDMELAEVELETVIQDKPVVNLGELLRQELLLALPEKLLCRENCSGLCLQCGANLNDEICTCAKEESSSPFAVLAALKKK